MQPCAFLIKFPAIESCCISVFSAVCEMCGIVGTKDAFFSKTKRFCSVSCSRSYSSNSKKASILARLQVINILLIGLFVKLDTAKYKKNIGKCFFLQTLTLFGQFIWIVQCHNLGGTKGDSINSWRIRLPMVTSCNSYL